MKCIGARRKLGWSRVRESTMVKTNTLDKEDIIAMMDRVNSVPMMQTLNLQILRLDRGECDAKVPRTVEWDGIYETMHGGILATIADSVTCWAILTEIGANELVATTDFNIRFLRPCLTDAICHARVIKSGKRLCGAEADLLDTSGRKVAGAQATYARLGN